MVSYHMLVYPNKHGRTVIEIMDTPNHFPHPGLVRDGKMAGVAVWEEWEKGGGGGGGGK